MLQTLHINDNNLVLQTLHEDGGSQTQTSQGYAWLKDSQVEFDINSESVSPVGQCRKFPQQINNRY